jgi:hypothetical protein
MTRATPSADAAWSFIRAETLAGRPFPGDRDIAIAIGRGRWTRPSAYYQMHILAGRGLIVRTFCRRGRRHVEWSLTPYGLLAIHNPEALRGFIGEGDAERAAPLASPKCKPKARKPRRIGSPTRVPHKPTAAHKKPTRQQRRESDRRREHEDRVTL